MWGTPETLWKVIANAEYRCCSFGNGLVTVMWAPWPAKGGTSGALEDGRSRRSLYQRERSPYDILSSPNTWQYWYSLCSSSKEICW